MINGPRIIEDWESEGLPAPEKGKVWVESKIPSEFVQIFDWPNMPVRLMSETEICEKYIQAYD